MGGASVRAHGLSKSKLLSWLQCPKRLWLEVHKPQQAVASAATESLFKIGHSVGDAAQRLYRGGVLIGSQTNLMDALAQTTAHIEAGTQVLFEPTFQFDGVLVRVDILSKRKGGYEVREVKASASVKDYHLHDTAIQAWVIQGAGLRIDSVVLQYVNTSFVYPGNEDYRGLFAEQNVEADIRPLSKDVGKWADGARKTLGGTEPERRTGKHCHEPFDCPCLEYCSGQEPQTEYPLSVLPHAGRALEKLREEGYRDVRDIPPGRLTSETQEKVRRITQSGRAELEPGAKRALAKLGFPRYHFDFETIGFAVPIWPGTRPYQQVPFQWSCHIEQGDRTVEHKSYLHSSSNAPMYGIAASLLEVLGQTGPILAYNAGFEKGCIEDLARMLPERGRALRNVNERFFDLLAVTRDNYYHPAMKGSWSLKSVLPTVAPELSYENVGEVKDGSDAQSAYLELMADGTPEERRAALVTALERYCERDTVALVRLSRFLETGR